MPLDMLFKGEVNRQIPDANTEHNSVPLRVGKYQEAYALSLINTMHLLADEGTYFTAVGNTTVGTGIAFAINAAVSETAGYFINLKNNDAASNMPNARRVYLDYIKLMCTTAPASATAGHFFIKVDNINRYSSGGSTITPVNVNLDGSIGSIALLNIGALTTVAPSVSARQVGRGVLRSSIPIVNDVYIIKSGSVESNRNGSSIGVATALVETIPIPPIVIGPQQTMGLQLWFPGNATTAGSFEVEMGWFER